MARPERCATLPLLMEIETARRNMVEQQLRESSVLDSRVLSAFLNVRREDFVPPEHAGQAFADTAIPLSCGQHMMSPRNQGLLLQSLELQPGECVLEVGTGSGFLTACMRHLGTRVDSLEIHPELARTAQEVLSVREKLEISVRAINAWSFQTHIRYDAVVITASMPDYNPHFEQWLKPSGRLFVVTGRSPVMEARLIRQYSHGKTSSKSLFELELDPIVPANASS